MAVMHLTKERGAGVISVLVEDCDRLGVPVLTNAPAKQILVEKNSKVTGVLGEINEKECTITTKSIIIVILSIRNPIDILKFAVSSQVNEKFCLKSGL